MSKINNGSFCYSIEKVRAMVRLFDNCNESFNQRFSVEELAKLHRAYVNCAWDIAPDRWEERQVKEALKGKVPVFDENENPVYTKSTRATKEYLAKGA